LKEEWKSYKEEIEKINVKNNSVRRNDNKNREKG